MDWKEALDRLNSVGARYTVRDETGEYVTGDTCDSLVILHEADGKVFLLLRPVGWTNGEQYEHLVRSDIEAIEGILSPLFLKMVREDGWTITLSPLNKDQKQDWVRWQEYKKTQDWYERVDSETIAKWTESAMEWRT